MIRAIFFFVITLTLRLHAAEESEVSTAMPRPLYEFGLYGGLGFLPDYPASDQGRLRYIFVPVGVYRGEILRASDRDGLTARILRRTTIRLNVSVSGAFSTQGSENKAREGMPDLDWLAEIGPNLSVILSEQKDDRQIRLDIPFRHMLSTNFKKMAAHGWIFNPGLRWIEHRVLQLPLSLFTQIEATWVSEGVASYFYHVPFENVTSTRPSHFAAGGFLEYGTQIGLSYRNQRWHGFGGISYTRYDGSANANSPLFRTFSTVGAFVGFGYWFYQSDELEADHDPS